ncbi:hypothetical protein [Streptomyces sp. WP-1]|uniref:hypothetical protein n=1 Tax=Streptomyces sp. WP-1 TaxID=3041497 RepID=UPI002648E232|nr:hypothetical protein [Streptomyces sp. WP-1]WKE70194.1 hypothetical protein QHG49_14665 [Streptomyces sp. WP-1]
MNEQQATERAEDIVHQAVDGMSPKPTLKRTGLNPVGACLADDHSAGERRQVTLSYQLTGVPGTEAKKLVRQARDAWVRRGYTFQSSDADWSDPFPTVNMRTVPDDFWMTALTGVVDKARGEGLAAITVTSPCFNADGSGTAASSSFRRTTSDEQAYRLATYQEGEERYAHHSWSTEPLTEDATAQVLTRARANFQGLVARADGRRGASCGDDHTRVAPPRSRGAPRGRHRFDLRHSRGNLFGSIGGAPRPYGRLSELLGRVLMLRASRREDRKRVPQYSSP